MRKNEINKYIAELNKLFNEVLADKTELHKAKTASAISGRALQFMKFEHQTRKHPKKAA